PSAGRGVPGGPPRRRLRAPRHAPPRRHRLRKRPLRFLRAALLAAAGCSSTVVAGDLPGDAAAGLDVVACDASYCGALCNRCLDADAHCMENVIGACNVVGVCVLRPPACTFTEPKHPQPDSACLSLRCGDPCTPGCVPGADACAAGSTPL